MNLSLIIKFIAVVQFRTVVIIKNILQKSNYNLYKLYNIFKNKLLVLFITAESKQQVSNKKLIMVIGIVALLTAIAFISIALFSNTATGDIDSDSNQDNDSGGDDECEDEASGGGWGACLIQDFPHISNSRAIGYKINAKDKIHVRN